MKFVVCPSCKYIVTVNIDCGATGRLIGSETTKAPFGIVKLASPLNVTVWSVLVWIAETPAEPLTGRATVTAVIGRSVVPKAFEIRILILSPPIEVCIVCRIVEFTKTEPL
jgi:hypothetical protein